MTTLEERRRIESCTACLTLRARRPQHEVPGCQRRATSHLSERDVFDDSSLCQINRYYNDEHDAERPAGRENWRRRPGRLDGRLDGGDNHRMLIVAGRRDAVACNGSTLWTRTRAGRSNNTRPARHDRPTVRWRGC